MPYEVDYEIFDPECHQCTYNDRGRKNLSPSARVFRVTERDGEARMRGTAVQTCSWMIYETFARSRRGEVGADHGGHS
jgi:hypothetical protein